MGREASPQQNSPATIVKDIDSNDDQDIARTNALLKPLGYYCKDILGDGNCLFRALADQHQGNQETHAEYRQKICDYIANHRDDFEPFIEFDEAFDHYLDRMRSLGTFGGHLELVAFTRNYRTAINIYHADGTVYCLGREPSDDSVDNTSSPRSESTSEDNPGRASPSSPSTVYLAYHSWEHYSSIRCRAGPHDGLPRIPDGGPLVQNPNSPSPPSERQQQLNAQLEALKIQKNQTAKPIPQKIPARRRKVQAKRRQKENRKLKGKIQYLETQADSENHPQTDASLNQLYI
ncbi:2-oxoglutarate dehydrogenase E1 component [Dispira parvispora]|uniref:2-oxoglutarate dehydrogenase E1 component n=1 Tax=Dispira parvispora TaxID=1520584 RepID=A0A9W8ASL1_9FUNG|nr:2-oxoglutarate dehydrogenase E1 component [Dispira parvispora]